ncbi:MAG: superoxide dismutase [Phycisphaerales bacterium]|nr:MAG: superoxide dismutase [Phycisphaerales bacterium]
MAFTVPDLPYDFAALEPHIDARTMEIHHGKHHAAYVNNLNLALDGHKNLQEMSIEDLCTTLDEVPETIRTAVRNNAGGHFNHSLFWTIMAPNAGGKPSGELAEAIDRQFGSFSAFQDEFTKTAATRFGSGWAWLSVNNDGELRVCSTPNQDNPLMACGDECGTMPILGLDVWEHAYYLHYQNRRPDYIKAWWNVVNWEVVSRHFVEAYQLAATA